MAIRKKETALSEAMDNLDAARTVRAEWEQELAAADAELAAAQAELPVSPAESPVIAVRRTQARQRIEVAKNALEAASALNIKRAVLWLLPRPRRWTNRFVPLGRSWTST